MVANLSEEIFESDNFNFSNSRPFLPNNPKTQNPANIVNLEDKNFILCWVYKLFPKK